MTEQETRWIYWATLVSGVASIATLFQAAQAVPLLNRTLWAAPVVGVYIWHQRRRKQAVSGESSGMGTRETLKARLIRYVANAGVLVLLVVVKAGVQSFFPHAQTSAEAALRDLFANGCALTLWWLWVVYTRPR